ncbi:hypothetical protein CC1G_15717 [Coprinopsis cinerea okayama7|uniref:Uncharacterized protein n=1 Tax=Coprinopsis cinerea (strain Okayama-7 / 130 / ATCC MYA-4618 / FGSC 9003) TaxID=240176 RepID=D6RQH8_COPC7|nr:hypothetical protein CC1G_15717 [Coprinopsis cinerea okayama7\|eukprot:XP_002910288.1 hypothetical protein CC1G_15717 [Coprinopsis cinerea okayama7\
MQSRPDKQDSKFSWVEVGQSVTRARAPEIKLELPGRTMVASDRSNRSVERPLRALLRLKMLAEEHRALGDAGADRLATGRKYQSNRQALPEMG